MAEGRPRGLGQVARATGQRARKDGKEPHASYRLTTSRCRLRPLTADDTPALHELWISPGVRRFLWDDEIIPIGSTRSAIEKSRRMFRQEGFGLWGAWSPTSGDLIGFAGLWPFRDPPVFELLYGVTESLWGRGYAPEIAQAVMTYCFQSLQMPIVRASTDAGNVASVRVLEKLGFQCVRRRTVGGLPTVFYEMRPGNGGPAPGRHGE